MGNRRKRLALAALTVASTLAALGAQAQAAGSASRACFSAREWSGWKASPDAKSIYIRVGVRRIYRLDMSNACPALRFGVHLATRLRGGSTICSPLDLDLRVSDGRSSTPCIVSGITPLSDGEAAALPQNLRP